MLLNYTNTNYAPLRINWNIKTEILYQKINFLKYLSQISL